MLVSQITPLDVAAKIDQTADYECQVTLTLTLILKPTLALRGMQDTWGGELTYPPPFGHKAEKEEAYIASLDAKTGFEP